MVGSVLTMAPYTGLPAIRQIAIDAERCVLYTLTDDSSIEVRNVAQGPGMWKKKFGC